ncbi:MAG TPA: nicotinate phosphoribosyltransferase [bacterium]
MLGTLLREDHSPTLATDQYQLTMALGYWKNGMAERQAVFEMYFRKNPFGGGYVLMAGLETLIGLLQAFRFTRSDLDYLAGLKDRAGLQMFEDRFLRYLEELRFTCSVSAIPEGTPVFPVEPLVRVQGPILQAQLLETLVLNTLNFQSLVATKAARVCHEAKGDPVVDFGLRRAQGIDGGLSASRACYVGGCTGTSNVLAGKLLGIPVSGTHAHSWVMSFDSESEAFQGYAKALPNNCVFLVDTYGTLNGIKNAITVAQHLKAEGHHFVGVRLDSGDLAYFSIQARQMLDAAGFTDAAILASNELDEYVVRSLKVQGARISMWGVGTKMATAYDEPALSGVYKLSAMEPAKPSAATHKGWQYKLKLSEQRAKISLPGIHQVYRYLSTDGRFAADAVVDAEEADEPIDRMVDPDDDTKVKMLGRYAARESLLVDVFDQGKLVYDVPRLADVRERTRDQLARLDESHKRLEFPHIYPVGLSPHLARLRNDMIRHEREVLYAGNHTGEPRS